MKDLFKIKCYYLILLISTIGFAQSKKVITSKQEAQKKGVYKTATFDKALAFNEPKTKKELARERKELKARNKRLKKVKALLNTKNAKDIFVEKEEISYVAQQVINNAVDNVGVNYSYGGTSKNGFDCSGLLYTTFKKFNVDLPRVSSNMADVGKTIRTSKAEKGDLIFFATAGGSRITHVGIITEVNDDEILFVHASTSSGVVVSSLSESYYKNSFVQINRILEN